MLVDLLAALFCFIGYALALDKDQIFQSDWQTVHVGVPFTSLQIEDQLITLSTEGVLSILNATTGDVLNRFQSEDVMLAMDSGLFKINDDQILSYFNYDDVKYPSKIIAWNMTKPYGIVDKEFTVKAKVLSISAGPESIAMVTDESILLIQDGKLEIIHHFETPIGKSQIIYSPVDDNFYVFVESEGNNMYSTLNEFRLKSADQLHQQCDIKSMRYLPSINNILICNDKTAFEFDQYDIRMIKTKGNLVTEKLMADSLVSGPISEIHIIEDYVLLESDGLMSLFNYKTTGLTPNVQFHAPPRDSDILHNHHSVYDNSTKVGTFVVAKSGMLQYYINGELEWFRDESFTEIVDAVIIDPNIGAEVAKHEHEMEEVSNFFHSFYLKVIYFYHELFGNTKKSLDDSVIFGMSKIMVTLTLNNKIGIYDLVKERDAMQLKRIFTPSLKIDKLITINNQAYTQCGGNLYKLDVNSGEMSLQPGQDALHLKLTTSKIFNDFGFSSVWEKENNLVKGLKIAEEHNSETFKYSPNNADIISFTKRTYTNEYVAQNGVILPDRSVLYKYLLPNLGVVATHNKASNTIMIQLLNLITGQTYGSFTKSVGKTFNPQSDFNLAFEENFIIFTMPDSSSAIDTQICVIDLFESLKPNEKITDGNTAYSAFEDVILPAFAFQSFIIPGTTVRALTISQTKHNIASKNVIISTSTGQVMVIPKMILDGRRGGFIGDFKTNGVEGSVVDIDVDAITSSVRQINTSKYAAAITSRFAYNPLINISPQAVLTHYRKVLVDRMKKPLLFTVPTNLESTTYVVLIDGDIFVTVLRPSGSFDKLTSSFNTKTLVATIAGLVVAILIIRPRTQKAKILAIWGL